MKHIVSGRLAWSLAGEDPGCFIRGLSERPPLNTLVHLSRHFGWDSMGAAISEAHSGLLSDGRLMTAFPLSHNIWHAQTGTVLSCLVHIRFEHHRRGALSC